ncbi:HD domain-containing protein [Ktedonosporobacter rubrisoli]|uniref:HD domain-containing protein n=1 Tax=Ktedonosporobacter rubrisoli TaxID=2509675 RepID=A0A4P6JII4_KTERU|nr:HD domain-containing protein [Ktedonosporobacter rubrisoli]QBD74793.1 HD domain-containing protein [Ktedonosporobacter rubrisoli]
MEIPFCLETELEKQICADPDWCRGARWGKVRPGHREGKVINHIADVLKNVDRHATNAEERRILRLVALLHDTFKYQCTPDEPDHEIHACNFARRYLNEQAIFEIVELHDKAGDAWRKGTHHAQWPIAERMIDTLIERLDKMSLLNLYLQFMRCDTQTSSKNQAPLRWFEDHLRQRGYAVLPEPAPYRRPFKELPLRILLWTQRRLKRLLRLRATKSASQLMLPAPQNYHEQSLEQGGHIVLYPRELCRPK